MTHDNESTGHDSNANETEAETHFDFAMYTPMIHQELDKWSQMRQLSHAWTQICASILEDEIKPNKRPKVNIEHSHNFPNASIGQITWKLSLKR